MCFGGGSSSPAATYGPGGAAANQSAANMQAERDREAQAAAAFANKPLTDGTTVIDSNSDVTKLGSSKVDNGDHGQIWPNG